MNVEQWLEKVAYVGESDIEGDNDQVYYSDFDGSYITHVGLEASLKFFAEHEITEELTHGVGYSPKEKKWYGWSHRAIYGFTIGSTCKKGDCHYKGRNLEEQKEAAINFWKDKYKTNVRCVGITENKEGEQYFQIKWDYSDLVQNKKLKEEISGTLHHIKPTGLGEWTAKTMEDAKQMAIDFNEGVS